MADPATYRPTPGSVPDSPGVYRFLDEHGRVIYVGKAKSLRARLSSYFQDLAGLHPRTQTMVTTAGRVEWTVVSTEVEAFQLEYSWIKEYNPRFNVRYRDDKSYPYLAVTLGDEYPRIMVMRGQKRKGVRYFGPYSHAWAIRETVDLLLRVFPARTCSVGVFRNARASGRPCLLGYIDKCSAPCVGRVSAEEHRSIALDFCDFMAGQTSQYIRRLDKEMRAASAEQNYERAARLRDDIKALERAMEKNAVVLGDGTDADVIALAEDELEAAVQVFYVRGGRVRGQRGWVVDKVEDLTTADLVEHFLQQVYGAERGEGVPREVILPTPPPDPEAVTAWLSGLRGSRVALRLPQRGDKRALLSTVTRNAKEALALHKTKRAGDLTTRSRALQEVQDALDLDQAPLRIECFDVSNLQGSDVVASMVVFEDGLARKGEYRRFTIRGVAGQDDAASIHEVLTRRFRRYLDERAAIGELDAADEPQTRDALNGPELPAEGAARARPQAIDPDTGRLRKFAYPPNLLVVDGGPPQVSAAHRALTELGIEDVAVCGLAKRLEEVWLPGEDTPVVLPRASEGLYLLQRVRDEAHRFAITFHRQRRSRSMVESVLDNVPGLGETRRTALLRHFGSLKRLRRATIDEIAEVPGIGRRTAEAVAAALATHSSERDQTAGTSGRDTTGAAEQTIDWAVNMATGEIIEGGPDGSDEHTARPPANPSPRGHDQGKG